jgi:hypothetical protein
MSDEFDDAIDPIATSAAPGVPAAPAAGRAARLVARLYASANGRLRTRLVDCLERPLGSLGVAAVAAGAFTVVLSRRGAGGFGVAMADVAEYSKEQVAELARFVEQVSPEALQQAAGLVFENRVGVGAFTASVALLLALELRRASSGGRPRPPPDQAAGA